MKLVLYPCPKCGTLMAVEELRKIKYCDNCGKFWTNYDRNWMENHKIYDNEKSSPSLVTEDARVKRLLEFAEEVTAEELVPVLVKEAAKEIMQPFGFALAGVLDRGTKAEIIWTIPYYLKRQLGKLDPYFFAKASIEEIDQIFMKLPTKPRYLSDASHTVKGLAKIVVNEYDGQAQKMWENRSAKDIQETFKGIYGVGPGIASMIVLLLERWFDVKFDDLDHRVIDVKPDVHIIRVFNRFGFISEPSSVAALQAARRLNPEFPGALDAPSWYIGRNWCSSSTPKCSKCPVTEVCLKNV